MKIIIIFLLKIIYLKVIQNKLMVKVKKKLIIQKFNKCKMIKIKKMTLIIKIEHSYLQIKK